jgi:PIN domain
VTLPIAVLDANVLYPTTLRDLLMWLAVTGTFDAYWTAAIQFEWTLNLLEHQPHLTPERLECTRDFMDVALPGALVTGYEAHIEALDLPGADDHHVLAATIQCEAQVIVTTNLRDSPASTLEGFGIRAIRPDAFTLNLTTQNLEGVLRSVARQRGNFKHPPLTRAEYLERLHRQGLRAFTA